jgi:hypothetical protein
MSESRAITRPHVFVEAADWAAAALRNIAVTVSAIEPCTRTLRHACRIWFFQGLELAVLQRDWHVLMLAPADAIGDHLFVNMSKVGEIPFRSPAVILRKARLRSKQVMMPGRPPPTGHLFLQALPRCQDVLGRISLY